LGLSSVIDREESAVPKIEVSGTVDSVAGNAALGSSICSSNTLAGRLFLTLERNNDE